MRILYNFQKMLEKNDEYIRNDTRVKLEKLSEKYLHYEERYQWAIYDTKKKRVIECWYANKDDWEEGKSNYEKYEYDCVFTPNEYFIGEL